MKNKICFILCFSFLFVSCSLSYRPDAKDSPLGGYKEATTTTTAETSVATTDSTPENLASTVIATPATPASTVIATPETTTPETTNNTIKVKVNTKYTCNNKYSFSQQTIIYEIRLTKPSNTSCVLSEKIPYKPKQNTDFSLSLSKSPYPRENLFNTVDQCKMELQNKLKACLKIQI